MAWCCRCCSGPEAKVLLCGKIMDMDNVVGSRRWPKTVGAIVKLVRINGGFLLNTNFPAEIQVRKQRGSNFDGELTTKTQVDEAKTNVKKSKDPAELYRDERTRECKPRGSKVVEVHCRLKSEQGKFALEY